VPVGVEKHASGGRERALSPSKLRKELRLASPNTSRSFDLW